MCYSDGVKNSLREDCDIVVVGEIRDKETALKMIEAGASRLGCSAGVKIMEGEVSDAAY